MQRDRNLVGIGRSAGRSVTLAAGLAAGLLLATAAAGQAGAPEALEPAASSPAEAAAWIDRVPRSAPSSAELRALVTNENAALRYWRAWASWTPESTRAIADAAAENLSADDAAVLDVLNAQSETIGQLIDASRFERCDWGVDYDDGVNALLPHLALMRRSVQLLALAGDAAIAQGDADLAAESYAAAFRMSEHAAQDRFIISPLVSIAMFALTREHVERALESGAFSGAQRAALADALSRFDDTDPFGSRAALLFEGRMIAAWLDDQLGEGDIDRFDALVSGLVFMGDGEAAPDTYGPGTKVETVRRDIELVERFYGLVHEAWDSDDAQAKLASLGESVAAGDFGKLARLIAPALNRAQQNDADTRATLDAMKERLAR
jgi:hypothetical protein